MSWLNYTKRINVHEKKLTKTSRRKSLEYERTRIRLTQTITLGQLLPEFPL